MYVESSAIIAKEEKRKGQGSKVLPRGKGRGEMARLCIYTSSRRRQANGVEARYFYDSFTFDGYFITYEANKLLLYEVFSLKRRSR